MEAAVKLFNRLTEVEKIGLRGATPGRVEYLADTAFLGDLVNELAGDRALILTEVQALCNLELASKVADAGFSGVTWKF
jgi:hypothetical protein